MVYSDINHIQQRFRETLTGLPERVPRESGSLETTLKTHYAHLSTVFAALCSSVQWCWDIYVQLRS